MNRIRKTLRSFAGAVAISAFAASAFCVPAAMLPEAAVAQSAGDAQLQQAVTALRGISTMRADFIQTDRNGQSVGGELTLKRPGRIRFQYEKDVPMLIVGDGKALTLIDYEVRQVQRWPISNSPLGALLDPKRDVAKFGTVRPTGNPGVISVEVRDSEHPEYGIITLIFMKDSSAPGGWELSYWVALDSQNKRTTVRLSNQRYGMDIPDSAFRWKDPRLKTRR